MVKLRKAEITDFETFKRFFEDREGKYQWLYEDPEIEKKEVTEEEKEEFRREWGDLLDQISEEYENYSIEKFEKLLSMRDSYLFMIVKKINRNEEKILGYIHFFFCGSRGRYKIAEWAVEPYDETIKDESLEKLLKIKTPKVHEYSICTIEPKVELYLLSKGFRYTGGGFYKLQL